MTKRPSGRRWIPAAIVVVFTVLALVPVPAAGQGQTAEGPVARTPWGDPDLQGVWDYWTFTPLERPDEFAGRDLLTAEEAAEVAQRSNAEALARDEPPPPGDVGAYSQAVWTDRARATALRQPSLLIDPQDGRLPSLTPVAEQQAAAHRAAGGHPVRLRVGGASEDGPDARGVSERCLLGFSTGPPMLPAGYNNNVQLFQAPGYVVLLHEMVHDVRVIPLDGRAPLPPSIPQWLGSSRGHWNGNTLVVETTDFTDRTGSFSTSFVSWGSAETLHLVERFTRVDADTVMYEFTVEDPATWTMPFTGQFPLNRSDAPLYEYACHEGNYGMFNMLSGARAEERAATDQP
ncbi:MAG: hypothetical protein QGI10_10045 [Vicinamibacterales bacterium]|jgi:hypothetical protein|nr:hypothetical protein [Vicinamibacterales bacterium]MDP7479596.1 hypothetical protein [Vicinamibacterales bacterium]HJN46927.1 hypothetical protein [Vicinamibacterales bacterium]